MQEEVKESEDEGDSKLIVSSFVAGDSVMTNLALSLLPSRTSECMKSPLERAGGVS
jgi:hypothetical protein